MSESYPMPTRFDREIVESERLVAAGHYDEATKILWPVIGDLKITPAADMFYTSWRIRRIVGEMKNKSAEHLPKFSGKQLPNQRQEIAGWSEQYFRSCLDKLNEKIARDASALVSKTLNAHEAFAASVVRFLEHSGRNFRLILKTNQGRLDTKLTIDSIVFGVDSD